MRRLANRILIVVAVFVVVVAIVLISRSRAVRVESAGVASSKADLRIKEVQLEEESGGVRWQLRADQALVFEGEGRTRLTKIHLKVSERNRSWTVVGEEGDLQKETKNLEVRRNVVLTSDDGLRLETTVLRWHGGDRRLWTDVPVRIVRSDAVIDGTGLDVKMEEEATALQGRVHAVFDNGRQGDRK
jgi:LPS export ABC transporter protein LptC